MAFGFRQELLAPGGAFCVRRSTPDSPSGESTRRVASGCPQWEEVPRVGSSEEQAHQHLSTWWEVHAALGYTGEAEWCPDASTCASS
jgi:hypothetical protein